MTKTRQHTLLFTVIAAALLSFGLYTAQGPSVVHAADNDFSNGITVDSTGDGADANVGDNVCDDGSGNCTLRAAIEESNYEAGTQTIRFNIAGAADFTVSGQNGYTIEPQSPLPDITDTVIIDGYTQPGSQANTAEAPNPLNGILLIEIDGNQISNDNGFEFVSGSDTSVVRGLVINNVATGDALTLLANDIDVQGNYIGTNPAGTAAKPNQVAINAYTQNPNSGENALVGGLDAEDRNLLSGNTAGSTPSASYPGTGWIFQGNYIGVAADGISPIANSDMGGSGGLSIDDCQDVIVGGPQAGAINVISGNNSHGIAPHSTNNLLIEGNYIGVGYDGVTAVPNAEEGITISESTDPTFVDNIVSYNGNNGIGIHNNTSGLLAEGNTVESNTVFGMTISASSNNMVGGSSSVERNIINDNGQINIFINGGSGPAEDNIIQGNYIGVDSNGQINDSFTQVPGITISGMASDNLVGGTNPGEGNLIAGNSGMGVAVTTVNLIGITTLTPSSNSILGNSIYHNDLGTFYGFNTAGSGIDLLQVNINGSFVLQSLTNSDSTPNDPGDADTGSNNYINFPVINSAVQDGLALDIDLDLDVADSPTDEYRVEIFANDTADTSGYGEGKTFLGYANLSPGADQDIAISLPSGTDLTGKVLSATTTAIDNTSDSGFGATSEFSLVSDVDVVSSPDDNNNGGDSEGNNNQGSQTEQDDLADTGQDIRLIASLGIFLITSGLATVLARRRDVYRSSQS